jgi:hypothetical protein
MAKLAGKTGYLKVGATTISVTKWEGTHEKTFLDTTDTGSGGVQEGIVGIESMNGTFEGHLDGTALVTAWKPGTGGAMELGVSATQKYTLAAVLIDTNKVSVDVKGSVTWSGTFKSNGAITQLI